MTSRRVQKASEAIREVVSMAILADLKDPRITNVTVTYVEVSPDMRQAKVHVSIMGDETKQKLSLRGLQNAAAAAVSVPVGVSAILENGEQMTAVIGLGGNDAAQKAFFPKETLGALPENIAVARLLERLAARGLRAGGQGAAR